MSSIIFTHGDSDGICAGAIVKSALPGSTVFFTSPVGLLGELNSLKGNHENIVICDIAVDEKSVSQLKERLNELSELSKITFMDHHPLPETGFNAPWFHHDECSSSEQAYRIFERKLNRDVRSVAIYGAMGDFIESEIIKKWMRDWDKRTLYFYAGVLIQGITYAGRDYDFKRRIVDALSEDIPPPQIEGLLDAAIIASQKEEDIKLIVRQKVVKLKNLAYVIDINGYMSKAAIYAAAYGDARVGISCEHRSHKHVYDMSIRLRKGDADLNLLLRRIAPEYGGTGGGHPFAGGARIPEKELKAFLYDLDDALSY
jgi:single-stranded-DNA-specific exonuclease